MSVQDNERERELVRLYNLNWDVDHQRSGVDAVLETEIDGTSYHFEVEVKSTTTDTVSTARDVGMDHIQRWRTKIFVIGFYDKTRGRPELQRSLCLTPVDMEPWIASIESKVKIDFQIAELASRLLTLEDLFAVCGMQEHYTVADAKRLHKNQWSAQQYSDSQDVVVDGRRCRISQQAMLEILRQRSRYIAERGATLNNPHITRSHLAAYVGSSREVKGNWAQAIRDIAAEFRRTHPAHPAAISMGAPARFASEA